jgi:ABC-type amino acid transport substrate-binding protein
MVRENSGITSINDLADKRVNYVIGTTGEANLKKVLPKAKLLGFKSNTEAFSALSAGRADAFSQDDSILYGFLHEHCDVKVLPDRISEEPYGIAFRKDARSKPLQDAIQKILDDMAKEEYLQGLRQKWVRPAPPTVCAL